MIRANLALRFSLVILFKQLCLAAYIFTTRCLFLNRVTDFKMYQVFELKLGPAVYWCAVRRYLKLKDFLQYILFRNPSLLVK